MPFDTHLAGTLAEVVDPPEKTTPAKNCVVRGSVKWDLVTARPEVL